MFGRGKKKGDKPAKEKKAKPKKEKKVKAKAKAKKKPGVPVKKRPTDVYTIMLMMSLGFVLLACIFLAMELNNYGFPSNTTPWNG